MQLIICGWLHIVNDIGDEGAKALGEDLKENKTLTQLSLYRTPSFCGWIDACVWIDAADNLWMVAPCSGNSIGPEGAKALGEGLKENKTLTQLFLESMSPFRGWIDVYMGVGGCSR